MRSKQFIIVLALWVICECRACGGQGIREQGMSDSSANIVRHVRMLSYDQGFSEKGHILLDVVADGPTVNKQAHSARQVTETSLLHDRHFVHMSSHKRGRTGQVHRSLLDVVDETASDKQEKAARHVAVCMLSHDRHVIHTSSHDGEWLGEGHIVSSEVGDGTSTDDKLTNALQLLNVHESSHDRYVRQRMLLAARLSLQHDSGWSIARHTSVLDVVDVTNADKQANAVRRQGVDSALLRYAGLALSADAQTGVIYDVGLPPWLPGIEAQAMRLVPSSFKKSGLTFNEFTLPLNASFQPDSSFITLVYRRIANFTVYTLPLQYQLGGPVVGIISSPSNSTSVDPSLPQGSISLPPNTLINISLPMFSSNLNTNALCAFFSLNGSIFVSKLASLPNFCVSSTLGDFALIVQAASTPPPAQDMSPPASTASPDNGNAQSSSSSSAKQSPKWKLIVGVTCLALAGLALLVAIVLVSIKLADRVKHFFTTRFAGNEEALQSSLVGGSIAPTAGVMRTKPALEIDMVHFANGLNS